MQITTVHGHTLEAEVRSASGVCGWTGAVELVAHTGRPGQGHHPTVLARRDRAGPVRLVSGAITLETATAAFAAYDQAEVAAWRAAGLLA